MTKYLSASRLGITTAEQRALVEVAEIIGASPYVPDSEVDKNGLHNLLQGLGFNMNWAAAASSCGTVCCIGGHVSLHLQGVDLRAEHPVITEDQRAKASAYVDDVKGSLRGLYWPGDTVYDEARPCDAPTAIRNFLTTGAPRWVEVIDARRERDPNYPN